MCHDQGKFTPDVHNWFNIRKSINILYYFNSLVKKKHMSLSVDSK